jgi:hypothetical protein
MSAPNTVEGYSTVAYLPSANRFTFFPTLQDELQLAILSFVTTAPFEKDPTVASSPESMLTHTLPLVSKKFHTQYCNSNLLWRDAIVRQLRYHEPQLWKDALRNLISQCCSEEKPVARKENEESELPDHAAALGLVEQTFQALSQDVGPISYKYLYERVLNEQLRFVGPVFVMAGDVVLGQSFGLHMFENRYRYMIRSIMSQQKLQRRGNKNGETKNAPVYFIHANRGNVRRSEMAVLVQVIHCEIYPDGRADIVVVPVHHVWIERSWLFGDGNQSGLPTMIQTPPPNNLFYAQCLKMGQEATSAVNHLQRQETLAHLMERLITSGMILSPHAEIHQQQDEEEEDYDDENATVTTTQDSDED